MWLFFFCYIIANGFMWLATETVFPVSTEGIRMGVGGRGKAKILAKNPKTL